MQTRKQLLDHLVSIDPTRRTPEMIEGIFVCADQGHGRKYTVAQTGYGDKTVRKVLAAYRAWQLEQVGLDSAEASTARDSGSVASDDDASEPDGKDWLFTDRYTYNSDTDCYIIFLSCTPKPLIVPGAKHRAIVQAYSSWDGNPASINSIGRTFGLPRTWFKEYRSVFGLTHDREPFTDEEIADRDVDELVADALQMKKLSLSQKFEQAKWREIKRDADAWNKWSEIEKPKLLEAITAHARKAPKTIVLTPPEQRPFAVFAAVLQDLHFGKYGSANEVRSPYNRQIATERVFSAVERLIQDVLKTGVPERWILPVGGDMIHVDGPNHTTTAGTKQDVDGTFREIYRAANALMIDVIDMLLQVAPVDIYPERGNHDEVASFTCGEYAQAWYRNDPRVTVNRAMQERQYAVYGSTLIGISHGDKAAKPVDLVRKMMSEARPLYAKTDHHVIVTAHLHSSWMTEIDSVLVYRRPSLSGGDIWHEQNAYTGNAPAIMALCIDQERGPYHHLLTTPTRGI